MAGCSCERIRSPTWNSMSFLVVHSHTWLSTSYFVWDFSRSRFILHNIHTVRILRISFMISYLFQLTVVIHWYENDIYLLTSLVRLIYVFDNCQYRFPSLPHWSQLLLQRQMMPFVLYVRGTPKNIAFGLECIEGESVKQTDDSFEADHFQIEIKTNWMFETVWRTISCEWKLHVLPGINQNMINTNQPLMKSKKTPYLDQIILIWHSSWRHMTLRPFEAWLGLTPAEVPDDQKKIIFDRSMWFVRGNHDLNDYSLMSEERKPRRGERCNV